MEILPSSRNEKNHTPTHNGRVSIYIYICEGKCVNTHKGEGCLLSYYDCKINSLKP